MLAKSFIFFIWAMVSPTMVAEEIPSGAFVSREAWETEAECQKAANYAMQIMTMEVISEGAEPPYLFAACVEHMPGQDI